MWNKLFNPDNPLMITMSQVTDCIFLSLFWFVCSVPLLTLGASTAALYDAAFYGLRKADKHSWGRFWDAFKKNLKSGIVPSLVFLLIFCAAGWGVIQVWNAAVWEQVSFGLFSAAAFVVALLLGILSILFPQLSRFNNSTKQLLLNTALLGILHLPRTLGLGFLNAACILLCARFVFPLFFLPALTSLLSTWLIEPMFRPYMPEEE